MNELREKVLKIFGAELISAQWSKPPEEVADQILSLVAVELDKALPKEWYPTADPESLVHIRAAGHNDCLNEVRQLLKVMGKE